MESNTNSARPIFWMGVMTGSLGKQWGRMKRRAGDGKCQCTLLALSARRADTGKHVNRARDCAMKKLIIILLLGAAFWQFYLSKPGNPIISNIASDGSVIRSLSMPILSPISVQKIEAYLGAGHAAH